MCTTLSVAPAHSTERLTSEQKKRYVEYGGVACPHCGSENLDSSPMQTDAFSAWCEISCGDCERHWTDIYKLVDISEED